MRFFSFALIVALVAHQQVSGSFFLFSRPHHSHHYSHHHYPAPALPYAYHAPIVNTHNSNIVSNTLVRLFSPPSRFNNYFDSNQFDQQTFKPAPSRHLLSPMQIHQRLREQNPSTFAESSVSSSSQIIDQSQASSSFSSSSSNANGVAVSSSSSSSSSSNVEPVGFGIDTDQGFVPESAYVGGHSSASAVSSHASSSVDGVHSSSESLASLASSNIESTSF